jgi:hypothetical protein
MNALVWPLGAILHYTDQSHLEAEKERFLNIDTKSQTESASRRTALSWNMRYSTAFTESSVVRDSWINSVLTVCSCIRAPDASNNSGVAGKTGCCPNHLSERTKLFLSVKNRVC